MVGALPFNQVREREFMYNQKTHPKGVTTLLQKNKEILPRYAPSCWVLTSQITQTIKGVIMTLLSTQNFIKPEAFMHI